MDYILLFFLIVFLFYILKDTPLFEAARNGHTYIVWLLIENGADVNKEGGVRWKHKSYMLSQSISTEPELKNYL